MLGAVVFVRWRNEGCLREKLSFLSAVSVLAGNAKLLRRELPRQKSWATNGTTCRRLGA